MRFSNFHIEVDCIQPILDLEIDGRHAEIIWEQKPTLFKYGLIFIMPEDIWSKILPEIIFILENQFRNILHSFIRSYALIPLIEEMCGTVDFEAFNKKWGGVEIEEDLIQLTEYEVDEDWRFESSSMS